MTFRRYIQITVLAIAGNIYLPVSGQENLLREFDAFINKENKTFDNRIKQMNKEFADYLEREWIGFPTYTNQPLSIDPDTFFIKKEETKNRKEEIDIPLEKNNDIRSEAGQLIISFFGKSLSFPFTPSLIIPVNNAGEKAVSNAWRKASEMDYTPLLSMLLHYKKELRLNDWGYLQLVQQTAETIYARHNNPNGAVFLTTYLLNQSSFAARMGRIDNRLALLVEINETIYNVPQLKNGRQTLSIFTGQPLPGNATVFTYKESLRFATERISMHIPELPLLDGKTKKIDISMYRSLYPINLSDSCEDISVDTSGKKLLIKDKNDVLLNISFEELQTSLLQKSGLTKNSTKKRFLQQENTLTNYETDSLYISFRRIIFDMKTDLTISDLQIDYILRK